MAHILHPFVTEGFIDHCDQIVRSIFPEKIYLLGVRQADFNNQTIFEKASSHISSTDFLLLLLIDPSTGDLNLLQSRTDSIKSETFQVHSILLSTKEFDLLCRQGHPFAHKIIDEALLCYEGNNSKFEAAETYTPSKRNNIAFSRFIQANEAYNFANDAFGRNHFPHGVKLLHQSVCHAFAAIIGHRSHLNLQSDNAYMLHGILMFFLPDNDFYTVPSISDLHSMEKMQEIHGPPVDNPNKKLSTVLPKIQNLLQLCQQLMK